MYPEDNFKDVGFCKMDPIINGEEKGVDFLNLGLDRNKKTILYAPTFSPKLTSAPNLLNQLNLKEFRNEILGSALPLRI